MSLNAIDIPPRSGQPPQGLIILLHGWGANAQDLVPLANALALPQCHFSFPEAPFPHPYSPNGRMWYDLETQNLQQFQEGRQRLEDWLNSLIKTLDIPCDRILLGGFSQGGAMTLEVGLNRPFAGLICLSGYLHPTDFAKQQTSPPVFIAHGQQDPVVPLQTAQSANQQLTAQGIWVEYHEFKMGHEICPEVLACLKPFITARLNSAKN